MSRDRLLRFVRSAPPPMRQLEDHAKMYFGSLAEGVVFSPQGQRILIDLHGRFRKHGEDSPRWIEVIPRGNVVDVLTREMDAPTNALADAFTIYLALRYEVTIESGDLMKDITGANIKLTLQEMWDAIEKANGILFDTSDPDIEHTLHSHADGLPEHYRKVAKGAADAMNALQEVIQTQIERAGIG